jgi:pilus assembly protein CpaB
MKSKASLLLSLGLGVLAVILMITWASARESQLLQLSDMKDVLVVTRDVPPNTILDEQVLSRKQVPATYVQPGAVTSVDAVRGRIAVVPIPRGAQVLSTYLEAAGRAALAYEVPRGQRALTIAVSDVTGVAGLVRPGNFVDIFGTFEFGRPVGTRNGQIQYADEKTETRVLMQNVQVIAVEREHRLDRPEPRQASEDGPAQETSRRDRRYANVTVLAGPRDAQRLVLAQELGMLTLTLRSNLDAGQVMDLGWLDELGLLEVKVPVKKRPRPVWRELRGTGGLSGF